MGAAIARMFIARMPSRREATEDVQRFETLSGRNGCEMLHGGARL